MEENVFNTNTIIFPMPERIYYQCKPDILFLNDLLEEILFFHALILYNNIVLHR